MKKYVALLRGIMPSNPNMHNDKLRSVFKELGFEDVQTVIASGNVLFKTKESNKKLLEEKIEKALHEKLGINSTTIIRSLEELEALIQSDPFKGKEHSKASYLNVTFLKKGGEVFNVIDTTQSNTPDLMKNLEKEYGKEITTRTWKTIERIVSKLK